MKKEINNNGHLYMDLDLPSGTLWATCNVGASKPSDYGKYFQWGDTNGYTTDQVGKNEGKKKFGIDDYKFSINGSSTNFSKYTKKGDTLKLEDDAAYVNLGGDWHMPTPHQIRELIGNTTSKWTEQNNVKGRLFTSKNEPSKSIFIPAAGYAWYGLVLVKGGEVCAWSSTLDSFGVNFGKYLMLNSKKCQFGKLWIP